MVDAASQKKGAIYVGMAEGATPVEERTAFVLFPDEATKQAAKDSIPDMTYGVRLNQTTDCPGRGRGCAGDRTPDNGLFL